MGQSVVFTGMVISVMPIGDYDKRITILTKERGKISAFARGARKPNSQFLAATNPFVFGEFELFEGRSSYQLAKANVSNYFRELSMDVEAAYMGFYFLEIADYYCQENNDEKEMLKLLYQTLRALESPAFEPDFVRFVYELKAMAINGEGPNVFSCLHCHKKEDLSYFSIKRGGIFCKECAKLVDAKPISDAARYTLQFVLHSPVEKLYTFQLKEELKAEMIKWMEEYRKEYLRHKFKSLDVLKSALLGVEIKK